MNTKKIKQELAWKDEMLEVLVDSYLRGFDIDDDGLISFHEFLQKV